ncbi:MAG: glycoside hydrolase family 24 protein [Methylocella sp.]
MPGDGAPQNMARRNLTLTLIAAGLGVGAWLAFAGRAAAAQRTLDLDTGALTAGEDLGSATSLDAAKNEAGFFSEALAMTQPDINDALQNPNVQAFLTMVGEFEGGAQGYNALFGGGRFESFADHPRTLVKKGGYASTAAGRYQIIEKTWDDVAGKIGAPDFSPPWQDAAAVYLIRRRGALADVMAGNFQDALTAVASEWASLPGSPYGQPTRSLEAAMTSYSDAGGTFA